MATGTRRCSSRSPGAAVQSRRRRGARTKVLLYLTDRRWRRSPWSHRSSGRRIDRMRRRPPSSWCELAALGAIAVIIALIHTVGRCALYPLALHGAGAEEDVLRCRSPRWCRLVCTTTRQLVEANSKLGLIAGIVGAVAVPAVGLQHFSPRPLVLSAVGFARRDGGRDQTATTRSSRQAVDRTGPRSSELRSADRVVRPRRDGPDPRRRSDSSPSTCSSGCATRARAGGSVSR